MEPKPKALFVVQPMPGGEWLWVQAGASARTGDMQALAEDWRQAASKTSAVLLLPAEEVLLTRVHLPTRSSARIAQALPFALEEHLLEDPESMLCAPGPWLADGSIACGAIDRSRLRGWLGALAEAGIQPIGACPDALLLDWNEGQVQVMSAPGRTLLRWGAFEATAADPDLAGVLLEALRSQPGLESAEIQRQETHSRAEMLGSLARQAQALPMDFMLGEFLPVQQRGGWRAWRLPAAMAASALLLAVAAESLQTWRMSGESERLADTLRSEFSALFPDIKRVQTDPAPQIELELRKLRQATGRQHGALMELLSRCAPVLASSPTVSLARMQYRDGRLELGLESRTIAELDSLRLRLEAAGMNASQGSAQLEGNQVRGTISVTLNRSGGPS